MTCGPKNAGVESTTVTLNNVVLSVNRGNDERNDETITIAIIMVTHNSANDDLKDIIITRCVDSIEMVRLSSEK